MLAIIFWRLLDFSGFPPSLCILKTHSNSLKRPVGGQIVDKFLKINRFSAIEQSLPRI